MRRLAAALLLLALLAFAAHAGWYADHHNDDAYITFRYARFLATGQGPYFNPGEHVEGYTNFLLMLLSSAVFAIAGEAATPVAAKGIGVASGLAAVAIAFLLARRLLAPVLGERAGVLGAATAALLLAGAESFALNSTSGLETTLFTALVALGVLLGLATLETGRWRGSGLAFGAACLARPEGPLLAAAFWVTAALRASRGDSQPRRSTLRALALDAAVLAATVGAHLVFRLLAYDGEWLPNTFYAKIGGSGEVPLRLYIQAGTLLPFLGLPGALLALVGLGLERRLWRRSAPLAVTAVLAALLPVFTGTDWMPGWRLVVPALPLVAVLVALGWASILARLVPSRQLLLFLLPLMAVPGWWSQAEARSVFRTVLDARARGVETAHRPLALWLRDQAARPGDVVALTDIGLIGYLCPELRILDVSGLTDRHIAKSGGGFLSKDYDVSYVLQRRPRFVILVMTAAGTPFERPTAPLQLRAWNPIELRLFREPAFARAYVAAGPSAVAASADWLTELAVQMGARRIYEHPLPGARYFLVVYERQDDVAGPS